MTSQQCKIELDLALQTQPMFTKARLICTEPATIGELENYCAGKYDYQRFLHSLNNKEPYRSQDPAFAGFFILINHYIQTM